MPSSGLNLALPVSMHAPVRAGASRHSAPSFFCLSRRRLNKNSAKQARSSVCAPLTLFCIVFVVFSVAKWQISFLYRSLQALHEQAMLRQPTIVITPPSSTCGETSSTDSDNEIAEQLNTATLDDRGSRKRQCRCVDVKELLKIRVLLQQHAFVVCSR